MKKVITWVLTLIMVLGLQVTVFAAGKALSSDREYDKTVEEEGTLTESFVSKKLVQNDKIMSELFGEKAVDRIDKNSTVRVEISNDLNTAVISLEYQGQSVDALLKGTHVDINENDIQGHVGIYEGTIDAINNRHLSAESEGHIPVIADITFTRGAVRFI